MEAISIIATIIFALISMGLSVYFFVQAKDAEKQTAILLTEIKAQVGQLQKLTARWLDKSIDYFTQQHPAPIEDPLSMISVFSSRVSETLATQIAALIPPPVRNDAVSDKTIMALAVQLCHSSAQTNYFAQGYLPSVENIDPQNQFYRNICTTLDASSTRFHALWEIVKTYNLQELKEANVDAIFQEIQTSLYQWVRPASDVLILKSSTVSPAP